MANIYNKKKQAAAEKKEAVRIINQQLKEMRKTNPAIVKAAKQFEKAYLQTLKHPQRTKYKAILREAEQKLNHALSQSQLPAEKQSQFLSALQTYKDATYINHYARNPVRIGRRDPIRQDIDKANTLLSEANKAFADSQGATSEEQKKAYLTIAVSKWKESSAIITSVLASQKTIIKNIQGPKPANMIDRYQYLSLTKQRIWRSIEAATGVTVAPTEAKTAEAPPPKPPASKSKEDGKKNQAKQTNKAQRAQEAKQAKQDNKAQRAQEAKHAKQSHNERKQDEPKHQDRAEVKSRASKRSRAESKRKPKTVSDEEIKAKAEKELNTKVDKLNKTRHSLKTSSEKDVKKFEKLIVKAREKRSPYLFSAAMRKLAAHQSKLAKIKDVNAKLESSKPGASENFALIGAALGTQMKSTKDLIGNLKNELEQMKLDIRIEKLEKRLSAVNDAATSFKSSADQDLRYVDHSPRLEAKLDGLQTARSKFVKYSRQLKKSESIMQELIGITEPPKNTQYLNEIKELRRAQKENNIQIIILKPQIVDAKENIFFDKQEKAREAAAQVRNQRFQEQRMLLMRKESKGYQYTASIYLSEADRYIEKSNAGVIDPKTPNLLGMALIQLNMAKTTLEKAQEVNKKMTNMAPDHAKDALVFDNEDLAKKIQEIKSTIDMVETKQASLSPASPGPVDAKQTERQRRNSEARQYSANRAEPVLAPAGAPTPPVRPGKSQVKSAEKDPEAVIQPNATRRV